MQYIAQQNLFFFGVACKYLISTVRNYVQDQIRVVFVVVLKIALLENVIYSKCFVFKRYVIVAYSILILIRFQINLITFSSFVLNEMFIRFCYVSYARLRRYSPITLSILRSVEQSKIQQFAGRRTNVFCFATYTQWGRFGSYGRRPPLIVPDGPLVVHSSPRCIFIPNSSTVPCE